MRGDLRRRAWRWHFLAAFLVVPFVLWQSVTGTLYLWSEAFMDARHADMRFVSPLPARASLDAQVGTARATEPGRRLSGIVLPADPSRSTLVTFDDGDLPAAVFVDPYTARCWAHCGARRGGRAGRASCTVAGRSGTRAAGCSNSARPGPS